MDLMSMYEQILSKLGSEDRKELDKFILAMSNDISRNILRKLASPHSPISTEELPLKEIGGSKVSSLGWLDNLEKMGFVNSDLIRKGDRFYRVYDITDHGKTVVKKYNIFL